MRDALEEATYEVWKGNKIYKNEGIVFRKYHLTRQHSNEKRKQKVIVRGERFKPLFKAPMHNYYKFADRHTKFQVRD